MLVSTLSDRQPTLSLRGILLRFCTAYRVWVAVAPYSNFTAMLTQEFIEHMRQRLLADKKKLQEELGGLEPHTELGDGEDAAGELALDEANQDIIAVIKADLAKIEVALQKIDAGTYGIDDNGVPISQERLEVNPYADRAL